MIIGLGGRKRSGKSTVADYIIKTRGAKQYAFADGVRGIALSWYGHIIPDESYLRENKDKPLSDQFNEFPYSQCYLLSVPYWDNLDKNKRGVRTGRDLLKAIGDFGRDACPGIWTQILFDQLDEETEPTDLIVIDDVRMPDERARIRESGGLLVLLRRGDDEVVDEHWSENSFGTTDIRKRILESSRSVLPNATVTSVVMTANLREWRHITALRTSASADLEMRIIMSEIFRALDLLYHPLFGDDWRRDTTMQFSK